MAAFNLDDFLDADDAGQDAILRDDWNSWLADEPVMPTLSDLVVELDYVYNELRDLGYASLAAKLVPVINAADAELSIEHEVAVVNTIREKHDMPMLSKKQKKKQKQKATQVASTKELTAAPVVELKRALPRRKDA